MFDFIYCFLLRRKNKKLLRELKKLRAVIMSSSSPEDEITELDTVLNMLIEQYYFMTTSGYKYKHSYFYSKEYYKVIGFDQHVDNDITLFIEKTEIFIKIQNVLRDYIDFGYFNPKEGLRSINEFIKDIKIFKKKFKSINKIFYDQLKEIRKMEDKL